MCVCLSHYLLLLFFLAFTSRRRVSVCLYENETTKLVSGSAWDNVCVFVFGNTQKIVISKSKHWHRYIVCRTEHLLLKKRFLFCCCLIFLHQTSYFSFTYYYYRDNNKNNNISGLSCSHKHIAVEALLLLTISMHIMGRLMHKIYCNAHIMRWWVLTKGKF